MQPFPFLQSTGLQIKHDLPSLYVPYLWLVWRQVVCRGDARGWVHSSTAWECSTTYTRCTPGRIPYKLQRYHWHRHCEYCRLWFMLCMSLWAQASMCPIVVNVHTAQHESVLQHTLAVLRDEFLTNFRIFTDTGIVSIFMSVPLHVTVCYTVYNHSNQTSSWMRHRQGSM